jgi:predicted AAA+ superfamily ATPase
VAILSLLGFSGRERRELELDVPPFLPTRERIVARSRSATPRSLQQTYDEIWLGSLPALVSGEIRDRDLFYSSYLETYLQRDVKQLAQVGNELGFLRFLRACAARTAQLLNLSDLARDADVSVNTAKSWLSILKASHQVFLLEPYHSNATKRLVKAPKLYFLDTGLCAYLTEWTSPRTLEAGALSGAIFETHVLGELLKSWWHRGRRPQLHYYRDRDGNEIDFILLENGIVHPLEVKRSSAPRMEWTRGWDRLERLGLRVGEGGVVCLCSEVLPLTRSAWAVPAGIL